MYKLRLLISMILLTFIGISFSTAAQDPLPTLIQTSKIAELSQKINNEIENASTKTDGNYKNSFTLLPEGSGNSEIRTSMQSLFSSPSYAYLSGYCSALPDVLIKAGFSEGRTFFTDAPGGLVARCNIFKDSKQKEEGFIVGYAATKNLSVKNINNIQPAGPAFSTLEGINAQKNEVTTNRAAFLDVAAAASTVNYTNKKILASWKNKNCVGDNVNSNLCVRADELLTGAETGAEADAARVKSIADAEARVKSAKEALNIAGCSAAATTGEKTECIALRTAVTDAEKELATASTSAATASTAESATENQSKCDLNPLTWGYCMVDWAKYLLQTVLVGFIAAPVLGTAGSFFDLVLRISIVEFSNMLGLAGANPTTDSTIYSTWVLVRNLFNIIILFQLLKIAIEKIIGHSLGKDKGDLKKKLVAIVIFSLLTNFSFFFTKAMIDLSNIVALQFYAGLGASPTDAGASKLKGSISIAIVDSLGIGTKKILGITGAIDQKDALGALVGKSEKNDFYDTFTGIIVVFCLLMLAAFILVQGAMIFLTRAVMLVFLIVLSPLMFAGGIMGFVDKWSKKWWDTLAEQLFVAPLYLAMLFITLKVAGNGTEGGLLKSLQGTTSDSIYSAGFYSGIAIMLIQGIVMGGLFLACVKIAKEYGGEAAKRSSTLGAKLYGGAVGGGLGYAGRKSIGRLGTMATTGKSGEWLQEQKLKGGGFGALASGALSIGKSASTSSFDMRKGLGASVNKINGIAGTKLDISSLGESKSKGFYDDTVADAKKRKDAREKAAKAATEIRGDINETDDEKKAREKANSERLATYGKVIAYELDSDGNHIMEEVRDANNNVVIDPVTGQPKKQKKVKMKDGKVVYEDSLTTNIITGTRDKVDLLTGAKKQSTINTGVTEDAIKNAKKTAEKKANEEKAERKYLELLGQEYDTNNKKIKNSKLKTPEEAKEYWEEKAEEYEEAREELQSDLESIKKGNKIGQATIDKSRAAYDTALKAMQDATTADPEISETGSKSAEWKILNDKVLHVEKIKDAVIAVAANPKDKAKQEAATKLLRRELIRRNTQIARARAAKKDIDSGANKFGILKEKKKDEVKPSPTA